LSIPEGSRAAAKGTLRERPVPRLIQQVFRKRITGCLVVTDDSGDVTRVWIREGSPVHAERPTDIDRLDRILVSSGLVSAELVAAADAEVLKSGRRLGEILIGRRVITREALAEVLKTQIRRKITRLFFAREGAFEIYVQPHRFGDGDEFPLMRADPRGFLYAGIRSAYDDDRLRNELLPLAGYLFRLIGTVPPAVIPGMGIDPADPTLMAVRDRALTLDDLPVPGAKAIDSRSLVLALLYSDLLDATVVSARASAGIPTASNDPLSAPVVTGHDRRTTWTAIPVLTAAQLNAAQAAQKEKEKAGNGSGEYSTARRPTPAPTSPADALRSAVIELNQKLDTSSHFEILGVPENATADEVNGMYMRAMRMYHPDRLAAAGLRELAPQAERVMARMGEAASVLRDPKRRADYVATRSGKKTESSATMAVVDAEKCFQRGEVFLRKGDYAQAIECFSDAIKVNPTEQQYRAYLAWARFDDPRARKELVAREALATLQQVVSAEVRFARGFFWIGQIWKFLNDPIQAEKGFREALRLDRGLVDAEREIRLLEMRKAKAAAERPSKTATAQKSGGLFGKFLKRNE
jgi:tetratricopeptide (TPR) repeat protein